MFVCRVRVCVSAPVLSTRGCQEAVKGIEKKKGDSESIEGAAASQHVALPQM